MWEIYFRVIFGVVITIVVEVPICIILTNKKKFKDILYFSVINLGSNVVINSILEIIKYFVDIDYIYTISLVVLEILVIIFEGFMINRLVYDYKCSFLISLISNFSTIAITFLMALNMGTPFYNALSIIGLIIIYLIVVYILRRVFINENILLIDDEK